jgi:hypothetical protein
MGKNTLTLMAKRIRQLMASVERLGERIKVLENKDTWESYISQEDTPCQYIFYICKVTSVVAADKIFYAVAQQPYTTTASPWESDADITSAFTVSVPAPNFLPVAGQTVRIDFTGTYGNSFLPRYGYFTQARIWDYGKLDGSLSMSGVQTVSVYRHNGVSWSSISTKVSVAAPPILNTTIGSGKWVDFEYSEVNLMFLVRGYEC